MNKLKKSSYYWLPPLVTFAILLLTYIVKGVYPFGSGNISYYDMGQQYIPLYARNYEILHGTESPIFSWLTGAGTDMTAVMPGYTASPFGWLTFFVKSSSILNFMSLFLMIKLMCASLTISVYNKKRYALPLPVHTALALMYSLSGYIVQHYTNIFFLDSMVLFPLLVLSLNHMKEKKREWPYMLLIALQLIINPYLSIMTLFFVLFYAFGLMLSEKDTQLKKEFAARVGLYTFTGIALAAAVFLPAVFKWSATTRTTVSEGITIASILGAGPNSFIHQKRFMLFNTELCAALLILTAASLIIRKKKPEREHAHHIYMFIVMLMPILVEGSLLVWHMGSYVHFPYRNAYMFSFAAIELAAYQYSHIGELISFKKEETAKKKGKKKAKAKTADIKRNRIIMGVLAGVFTAASIVMLVKMDLSFVQYGVHFLHGSYKLAPFIYLLNIAAFALIICIGAEKLRQIFILALITVNAAISSASFIAPLEYVPDDSYSKYVTGDQYIKDAAMLRSEAGLENDGVSRVKLLNEALSMNYAYILGAPTISQWTNEVVADAFTEIQSLGYDNSYTGNMDVGGTLFSDALMNDKKLIAYGDVEVPEELYSSPQQYGDYTVYDMEYTLPFGLLTDEKLLDVDTPDMPSLVHNEQLYEAFTDSDDKLITFFDSNAEVVTPAENKDYKRTYKINTHIDSKSVLYAFVAYESEIFVNGKQIVFPYFEETDNTVYPRTAVSGIVTLGVYDAGDIEIKINTNDVQDYVYTSQKMSVGALDLSVMEKLCTQYEDSCVSSYKTGKNSLTMTADVSGKNILFLPLEYLEGWKATVNGEPAEVLPVLHGSFMAIRLPDGHCDITMKYMPTNVLLGIALSLAGVAAAAFLILMKRFGKDLCSIKFINKTAYIIFGAVSVMMVIFANIDPIIARLVVKYQVFYSKFLK